MSRTRQMRLIRLPNAALVVAFWPGVVKRLDR